MIVRVILIAILLLLVVRALNLILRGLLIGAGGTPDRRPNRPVKLARDPVCGTHVSPRSALSLTDGGHTLYFCSEACREKFRTR